MVTVCLGGGGSRQDFPHPGERQPVWLLPREDGMTRVCSRHVVGAQIGAASPRGRQDHGCPDWALPSWERSTQAAF